jgi:hypothetical protein
MMKNIPQQKADANNARCRTPSDATNYSRAAADNTIDTKAFGQAGFFLDLQTAYGNGKTSPYN